MIRQHLFNLLTCTLLACGSHAKADDLAKQPAAPEPIPVTRDEMKRALDASKQAKPRLPAPTLTEAEKSLIKWQKEEAEQSGEKPRRFGLANNGRMRAHYLAEYGFSNGSSIERARTVENSPRDSDAEMDRSFRKMLFWIVSRGNNCTYCLGHQESSLAAWGMSENQLAALDCDWSIFDDAHQAAFALTRKLSFEPWKIERADIDVLRKHYSEEEILDIVNSIGGFNATNRWTGPLRIQQDVLFPFQRPTAAQYADKPSEIVSFQKSKWQDGSAPPAPRPRPMLETAEQVRAALQAAHARSAWFELASEEETKMQLDDETAPLASLNWVRLLAAASSSAGRRVAAYQAVLTQGTLDPESKAMIAYVAARHDRSWYALGHAMQRLKQLGWSDEQIFALDQPQSLESDRKRELVEFAQTITTDPALISDDDFAQLGRHYNDKQVAEIVYVTSQAAFFDRLTEAANLPLEP